jgi:hypothetical protein
MDSEPNLFEGFERAKILCSSLDVWVRNAPFQKAPAFWMATANLHFPFEGLSPTVASLASWTISPLPNLRHANLELPPEQAQIT